MSNQPKHIFDFFRKQYEEKSNQDQGWNAPPDFIFEDAISQVNTKKAKKKRFMLLFLLTGFIVGGIVATNLYLSSRINTIEQKVAKLPQVSSSEIDSKTITPSKSEIIKNTESGTPELTNNNLPDKKATKTKQNKTVKTTYNTAQKNDIKLTTTKQTTTQQKRNQPNQSLTQAPRKSAELSSNTKHRSFNAEESRQLGPTLKGAAILSSLQVINLTSNNLNKEPHRQPFLDLGQSEKTCAFSNPSTRTIAIALLSKYNYSSLKMQGPGGGSQSLTLYDKFYSGYGTQLNIQIPVVRNISLLGSLAYDKLRNKSLLSSTMLYNDANEYMMSSGMAMYTQNSEISTPMGELEDRMRFEVDPSAHTNGTAIVQNSNILQSITVAGLHLGPQIKWISCNKLEWSSALQLGVNYINKMITSVNSEYKIENHTMSTNDYEQPTIDSMKKLSTSISLTTHLNYRLSENYSLTGGISTMKSLSSLRSTGPSTKLVNWSTQIGITRKF